MFFKSILLLVIFVCLPVSAEFVQEDWEGASGRALLEQVYKIHRQFPYVYEEQSMVLIDRRGRRETRKLKRYSRVEENGEAKFLLVFDSPEDVKGVAVLASRQKNGETKQSIYLPAFSQSLIQNTGDASESSFRGTDFSVENIIGEELDEYILKRQRDAIVDGTEHYVVDVYKTEGVKAKRRHFILKDIMFIAKTEFYDPLGKLQKQQTQHDLSRVFGDMWRANMLLMQDFREDHQTLIKIKKRIFSADYVPKEVFTLNWLFENALQPVEYEMQEGEMQVEKAL